MTILELFIWAAHHKVEEFPLYLFEGSPITEEELTIYTEKEQGEDRVILG